MFAIRLSLLLIGILFPFLMLLVADSMRVVVPDFTRTLIVNKDPAWQETVMTNRAWHYLVDIDLGGILLLAIPCAVATAIMIAATRSYCHRRAILFPAMAEFGFLAHDYLMNTLNPDPQGAAIYIFGPIYSLGFIFIGWLLGLGVDRFILKKNK